MLKLFLIILVIGEVFCENYTNFDENYGITWMYFPDGNGIPRITALTIDNALAKHNLKTNLIQNQISFRHFTRKPIRESKATDEQDQSNKFSELVQSFNPELKTKIIIHGWMSNTNTDTVQNIKNNYLVVNNYNIIAIDWKSIASNINYLEASGQTRNVGKYTAELIDYLIADLHAKPSDIHIIGHSLGAHAAGYAGSYTKNGRVSRITGLDPAGPNFEGIAGPESRLDPTDAEFVDVIHTCGKTLGYFKPLGHVDFYPNKGTACQPGCYGMHEVLEACSHGRSHQFFAESILYPNNFYGYPCKNWDDFVAEKCTENGIVMGDKVPNTARGTYYLRTNDKSPFGLGNVI